MQMPAGAAVSRLDDVEAARDLLEAAPETRKILTDQINVISAPGAIGNIFYSQCQKIDGRPSRHDVKKRFKMIAEPLEPTLRTSPIAAAQLDRELFATMTTI